MVTVKSLRTNKLFVVKSSQLEDEDGSSISSTDLIAELKVVWNSEKGERQDVAIVNIHDEKPRKTAPLKWQREEEDSSDSTSDEVQPKPKVID
eukprot:Em0863g1a